MQLKQLAKVETLDIAIGFILNTRREENCLLWEFC